MTKNEREMVIELAKAVNSLASALKVIAPDIGDMEKRLLAKAHLEMVNLNFEELIRLIDAEWLTE